MKRTKVSRLMPFGKFKGMGIDEMEEDYMKKFVKYKRFTSNKGFMDRVRKSKFSYLKEGEVILLENIRFFKEEDENDDIFSQNLASLGDIYINDAFSCSHRKQASIHKIVNFLKESYAGPLLKKE